MTTTALTVTQRAAVALRSPEAEAHLIALVAGTKDITAPTNKAGRDQCHGAAMAALKARTAIAAASKTARADATAFGKAVIAEESRLVAIIEPEELRLKSLRDEWDTEQARIKAAAEKAEAERVSAIMGKIEFIRDQPARLFSASVEDCRKAIVDLDLMLANGGFEEFKLRAINAADDAKALLASMIEAKEAYRAELIKAEEARAEAQRAHEAEAARIAEEQSAARAALEAEREELKRIMAEKEDARKLEREKEAAEQAKRDAEAAEQRRIEREKLDADRAQFQAAQAAFAAARIAAEAAERAERERVAAEKAAIEAAKEAEEKAVRDAEEAARRVEAEKEADRRRATSLLRQRIDRALDRLTDRQLLDVAEFAEGEFLVSPEVA